MDVLILGTAAAEGWPAVFCDCSACRRARVEGGKNIRSRASIMVGNTHKIDFPPDAFYHEAVIGGGMSRLKHLFVTHTHQDHFDIQELVFLFPPFAHENETALSIWGSHKTCQKVQELKERKFPNSGLEARLLTAFEPVKAGDLVFTPIVAKHMMDEECFNYIVSDGAKSFLYTCDTGLYDEPTWEFLSGIKLDMIISECTSGPTGRPDTHMSLPTVVEMVERLRKQGTLREKSRVILTHFSHNGGALHEEMQTYAAPYGFEVAYDGMRVRDGQWLMGDD